MSSLAPRRRPIFNRRGNTAQQIRMGLIIALIAAIAGTSFAAGVQVGRQSQDRTVGPVLAAAQ